MSTQASTTQDDQCHQDVARRWLTVGVAALVFGMGVLAVRGQGSLADYLFLYTSASDQVALQIQFVGGCLLFAVLPTLLVRKLWVLMSVIPVWVLVDAWGWRTDASAYGDLVWGAHCIRYVAPVALMLMCWKPRGLDPATTNSVVSDMLRFGLAVTFAFHGIEALVLLPSFLDYAQSAVAVLGIQIGNDTAAVMLRVIGCWDITLACLVLFTRWRWPLYAMMVWGSATAGLRLLDGWWYYPDTILRLIHVLPAVAILILQRHYFVSKDPVQTKGHVHAIPN